MRYAAVLLVLLCGLSAAAEDADPPVWENPAVIGRNKEAPRATSTPYPDEQAAIASAQMALDALWTLLDGVHSRYLATAN